jgi:flagellar basal-body rod protein FlgC
MFDSTDVIASGLSAARTRMNVLASNIANADTTRTPEGGPYKRRDVLQMARSAPSEFGNTLDRMSLHKPTVQAVIADNSEPRMVYQPGHPDANNNGYVAYPNINPVTTMTDMMTTARLYQANLAALDAVRKMSEEARNISFRS